MSVYDYACGPTGGVSVVEWLLDMQLIWHRDGLSVVGVILTEDLFRNGKAEMGGRWQDDAVSNFVEGKTGTFEVCHGAIEAPEWQLKPSKQIIRRYQEATAS